MQTLRVDIQDGFLQDFMHLVEKYKDQIKIRKDKNLEYDSYFYERQEDLEQIIKESENGKMELLSQEQHEREMTLFFKTLKANADI